MNIKEVKDLIQEVLRSDIAEFELEHTGTRVKLKRVRHRGPGEPGASASAPQAAAITFTPAQLPSDEHSESQDDSALHVITSPIVGTFYRTPSPGAEPYVKTGDQVREGSVLCIVEAMKLMNQIPSDVEGEIAHIYVENGNPVEFGQRLFAIRLAVHA